MEAWLVVSEGEVVVVEEVPLAAGPGHWTPGNVGHPLRANLQCKKALLKNIQVKIDFQGKHDPYFRWGIKHVGIVELNIVFVVNVEYRVGSLL